MRKLRAVVLFALSLPFVATSAGAEEGLPAPDAPAADTAPAPPAPPPAEVTEKASDPEREAALALFNKGMALFRSGDVERAVDLLLESQKTFPSKGNTLNAAIALERVGRFDEALELYEETVTTFGARLSPDERAALSPLMESIRGKLGALDVSANVTDAVVLVDGRQRGRLPLTSAIRVLPGDHVIRILRGGYKTFEGHAHVDAGGKVSVDGRLERLTDAGTLRVEDATLASPSVYVDGVEVGRAPWEGILAPGPHTVWSRGGDQGSGPTPATVVVGQTALVRLRSQMLGAPIEIRTRPGTASIRLSNGVPLGVGRFQGALPLGRYDVDVDEEGYRARRVHLDVETDSRSAPVDVALDVDPNHPRWPRRPTGKILVSTYVGGGLGPSLGSGAETACPSSCTTAHPVYGALAFASGGYELPFRLSVELALGYVGVGRLIERTVPGPGDSDYAVRDAMGFSGFAFGAGVAYRVPLGHGLDFVPRLSSGLVLASSRDAITGTTSSSGGSTPIALANASASVSSTPAFVYPEVGVIGSLGAFRLGAALGAFTVLSSGPSYDHGTVQCAAASPACSQDSRTLAGEKAYASFVLFTGRLSATYVL